jgi:hypothetical protein
LFTTPRKTTTQVYRWEGYQQAPRSVWGVGIPFSVIAIVAIIFASYIRYRRLEKERLRQQERKGEKPVAEPVLPSHLSKPELQGSDVAAVTGAGGQALHNKPELDIKTATSTAVRSEEPKSPELDSCQTGTGSRQELDSDPSVTIRDIVELSTDSYWYELDAGDDARLKTRDV